jgi:hypothetical protein
MRHRGIAVDFRAFSSYGGLIRLRIFFDLFSAIPRTGEGVNSGFALPNRAKLSGRDFDDLTRRFLGNFRGQWRSRIGEP